ncbi:MAG: hypothetical protein ACI3XJ_12685 [Oscillospiraceae bacterium]
MGTRKVFYPIRDDTLIGILNDFDVILRCMMSNQNAVLSGITDVFPHTEFLTVNGKFIVAAQELIVTLVKSIETAGGITLDCSVADISDIKNLGDLSDALILNAVIDTALSKAIDASEDIAFAQDAEIAICKNLGDVSESLYLDGDISEITVTLVNRVIASLIFDGEIGEMSLQKDLGDLECDILLSDALNLTLVKSVLPQNADFLIDGEMEVQSVRYRKLGDLAGLTFADVADWTLYDFYYKEE